MRYEEEASLFCISGTERYPMRGSKEERSKVYGWYTARAPNEADEVVDAEAISSVASSAGKQADCDPCAK
jgi:hypothetical protein